MPRDAIHPLLLSMEEREGALALCALCSAVWRIDDLDSTQRTSVWIHLGGRVLLVLHHHHRQCHRIRAAEGALHRIRSADSASIKIGEAAAAAPLLIDDGRASGREGARGGRIEAKVGIDWFRRHWTSPQLLHLLVFGRCTVVVLMLLHSTGINSVTKRRLRLVSFTVYYSTPPLHAGEGVINYFIQLSAVLEDGVWTLSISCIFCSRIPKLTSFFSLFSATTFDLIQ